MTREVDTRHRGERRDSIVVRFRGQEYERDIAKCRRALLERQMEKRFGNVTGFAREIGCGPSTVYRFLNGDGAGSVATMNRVLVGLCLTFDDVHRMVELARDGDERG